MAYKVLITEPVAEVAVEILNGHGYEADVRLDLSPEELKAIIAPYDAMIVRSGTVVDKELLDAAKNLKIIGRAGVTVDNIDIESAVQHNVIVCNSPTSNIVSAAEYAFALMLACARKVPQANASMHAGNWDRYEFKGTELSGKTLGIFGLGRAGSAVAERAKAFGMKVIAHDPFCTEDRAAKLGVDLTDNIDDVLPYADFITVHLPLTPNTRGMFGAKEYAKMKKGVILVNAARPDIFDIDAMADFVAAGKIAAAAIDTFDPEPCYDSPLHQFDNVILTPHISAITDEAMVKAGEEIASYVFAGLEGYIVPTSITPTVLPSEVIDEMQPYVNACRLGGRMIRDMLGHSPKNVRLTLEGAIKDADPSILVAGLLDGFIAYKKTSATRPDDAVARAARHGIDVVSGSRDNAQEFASAVRIEADGLELGFTLFGIDNAPRIISMMGYRIDIVPTHDAIVLEYADAPGRIGVIGTILGDAGINISTMQIGLKESEKTALVYLNVSESLNEETEQALKESIELKNIWRIDL